MSVFFACFLTVNCKTSFLTSLSGFLARFLAFFTPKIKLYFDKTFQSKNGSVVFLHVSGTKRSSKRSCKRVKKRGTRQGTRDSVTVDSELAKWPAKPSQPSRCHLSKQQQHEHDYTKL
jgi:hypothetical protein